MARAVEDAILLASPRVVGEWVEHIAADLLAERAQRVADVESGSETKGGEPGPARPADVHSRVTVDLPVTGRDATVRTDMATGTSPTLTVSATSASRTRASPRSPRVAWLVAGAALAVAGASALLGPGRALVAPAADAVPSVKPPMATPGLVAGSAPVDSTPLAPNAAPESSASATAPVAVPSPAPGSTTSGRAVLPAPRRPLPSAHDCTPPYYFGADGTKRYKGQCL
jgi:serine/threonine-protein kinase